MNVRPSQRSRHAKPLTTIPQTSARFGHEGTRKQANNQRPKEKEKRLFAEAPSAGGAPSHFSLIVIPHQVIWRLTNETSPFLFLLSLHSAGHLNLEVTIAS